MKPYFARNRATLYQGDVLEVLRQMDSESVHCVVTSPPYWGLRDYGVEGQIGLEPTPEAYVEKMVDVFREVRRVLRTDGTVWLNLGDSYNGYMANQRATSISANNQHARPVFESGHGRRTEGLKAKDLVGIPWRVAFALQADGYYLRSEIIWSKPNPMPESVTDRPTKSHEYLFLLSKSGRYHYDAEAIKEPAQEWTGQAATFQRENGKATELLAPGQSKPCHRPNRPSVARGGFSGKTEEMPGRNAFRAVVPTRNKRSVWTIATESFPEAHFATYPQALVEPCIKAGCPEGGTVLDPFAGSGTTLLVAQKLGRCGVGIELNVEYCAIASKRLSQEVMAL